MTAAPGSWQEAGQASSGQAPTATAPSVKGQALSQGTQQTLLGS